jgi:hypothetical protein
MSLPRPVNLPVQGDATAAAKLDPVSVKEVPTRAGFGVKVIFGTVVKMALAPSCRLPVTYTVVEPAALPDVLTTKEPVIEPGLGTEHEAGACIRLNGRIVQLVSPELNPEPETCIASPPLPLLLGLNVMLGWVTVNVKTTVVCGTSAARLSSNVCGPGTAVLITLN